jgi:hypothetical protein
MDDPLVDISSVRVHCAVRLIAYYVTQGERKDFLRPLFDSPIFDFYWSATKRPPGDAQLLNEKWLVKACLIKWRWDSWDNFYPYPILQLLRRHPVEEQFKISDLLEQRYGFYG